MNIELFIIFVILNIANVIIQTIKSLCTIKCGKIVASLINALAYGFYTIVVVYMVCDLPLWLKVVVVGVCNLVGVYFVKWGEEKTRKAQLWKIELTVKGYYESDLIKDLDVLKMSYNYTSNVGKSSTFNIYCETYSESRFVKSVAERYKAKYFVSESKIL